jgi:hypothetical protein
MSCDAVRQRGHVVPQCITQMGSLRLSLIVVVLITTSSLLALRAAGLVFSCEADKSSSDQERKIKSPNWSLLDIKYRDTVKSIKLVMHEHKEEPGVWSYRARSEKCDIETTDDTMLAAVPEFLEAALRAASRDSPDYDEVITSRCLGELHITTSSGKFMLGITEGGFVLEGKECTSRNWFVSWGLAMLVDKILKDHKKQGLSEILFQKLSPELSVAHDKSRWHFLQAHPSGQEEKSMDDVTLLEQELKRHPRWELLEAFGEGDTRITKLRIVLDKMDALPWAQWARRDKEFVYETKDAKVLHLAETFLTTPLRIARPDGTTLIGPGDYCLGKVEVTTTEGTFFVGIFARGFSLESTIPLQQNTFFSWGLAKLIDDALFHERKEHLREGMFNALSGQTSIDSQKYRYEKAYPKTPGGSGNANPSKPDTSKDGSQKPTE